MQKIILYKTKYHNTPGYTTHTHSNRLLRILYKQNNHSHIFLERAVLEWYFAIFAICNVYKT